MEAAVSLSPGAPFILSIVFVGPGVREVGGGEFLDDV